MANKITKLNNLIRGDTPLLIFPITINGVAADLTGYVVTFTATASAAPITTDVPIIKITATGDTTGQVQFQLLNGGGTYNDTSKLVPGLTYYWDVQLSNEQAGSALRIFTPLRGTFGVDSDFNVSIL